ncbi:MAG: FliI/YscN family ATPase [Pseudomonadota bacterium]
MRSLGFEHVQSEVRRHKAVRVMGRVVSARRGTLTVSGLEQAGVGDQVQLAPEKFDSLYGEVVAIDHGRQTIMSDGDTEGIVARDPVIHLGRASISPDDSWLGRVIDCFGRPMDNEPLLGGLQARALNAPPPDPVTRRLLGQRLETGQAVLNTMLPVVRGQRIGLFAGSGVGKTTLLARLAHHLEADVVVIAMVGERGREVREFIEKVVGPKAMPRCVVVTATSDRSALQRRRCAWTAMAVAEYFRDRGQHALLLFDSITRFADAHREIALAAGEPATMRGYPPSVAQLITSLAERAGPGGDGQSDITAVFSVLVPGSDMEEPIADIIRGTLDGHVVLDREIAERGRFPAIDVLRSVSRALPACASEPENQLILKARETLGAYERAELMVQAGLYQAGTDPRIDDAIRVWPALDAFFAMSEKEDTPASFAALEECLAPASDSTLEQSQRDGG